jgi:TP901 family phage tail tape measure protein
VARDDVVVVVTAETRGFGTKMAGAEASVKGIDKAAGQAAKGGLGMMSSSMMRLGAAAAPVMALGLAFKSSVQEFAAFQTQAFQVGNITASTTAEITKFSHELIQLPSELGNSTDMMKGMYQAISAGIPEENALTFITENAKAAKGNLADMATTVKGSAAIMNAYNLDVSQTTDVLDAMVRTVDLGVLNFSELSENIGKGMSVAKAAGITYEELLAALAALTRGGLSVEEAMTAVKNIALATIKPQEEASQTARALGIELNKAAIESEGFTSWMQDLAAKVGGSNKAVTSLFGNVRGLSGALQFTSESGGRMMVDILDQLKDRTDRTDENFKRVTQTISSKWATMMTEISKVGIETGTTLSAEVAGALDDITEAIRNLRESGKLAEWAGDARDVFDSLASTIEKTSTVLGAFDGVADSTGATLTEVAGAVETVATAYQGIMGALGTAREEIASAHMPWEQAVGRVYLKYLDIRNILNVPMEALQKIQSYWEGMGQAIGQGNIWSENVNLADTIAQADRIDALTAALGNMGLAVGDVGRMASAADQDLYEYVQTMAAASDEASIWNLALANMNTLLGEYSQAAEDSATATASWEEAATRAREQGDAASIAAAKEAAAVAAAAAAAAAEAKIAAQEAADAELERLEKEAEKRRKALRAQEQAEVLKGIDTLLRKSTGTFTAMSAQYYDTVQQMGIGNDTMVEKFTVTTTELSDEWKTFIEEFGDEGDQLKDSITTDFSLMRVGISTELDGLGLHFKGTGNEAQDAWAMSMSDILADGTYVFGGLKKLAGEASDEISKQAKEMARAVETMAGGITSGMTGAMDDFFTATLTGRFDEYGGILNTLFEDMGATAGATLSDAIMGSLFGEGGMQEWMQTELAKLPIFGGEGGAFADMTGGQRAMGIAGGAGLIYGATQQPDRGAAAMQGAMGGAQMGMMLTGGNPIGMVIGAILGGAAGYLGSGVDTPTTQLSVGAYGPYGGYTGNIQARHQGYKPEMAEVYLQELFATYSKEKLEWINALREFGDAALFEQMGELPRFDSDVLKMPADAMAAYFTQTWLPTAMQNWAWPAMETAMGERFVEGLGQQQIRQLLATLPDEQRMGALTDIIGAVQGMGDLFRELDWDETMMPELGMGIMGTFRAAQEEMSNQFEVIRASWEHMNLIEIAQDWEMLESTIYDARQTELDMVRQIRQLTDDIVLSINQQIESLELGGMGEAEQRAYLEQRIAGLFGELQRATDPDQVAQLTSDIQQYASMLAQAYGEQLYAGSDNVFLEMMRQQGAGMAGLTGAGGGLAPGTTYADVIQAALEATRDAAIIVNQGFETEIHDANTALINELQLLADAFGIFRGELGSPDDWPLAEGQTRDDERIRDPREVDPRGGMGKPGGEIEAEWAEFVGGVETATSGLESLSTALVGGGAVGGGKATGGGGLADSIVLTDQRLIALATSTTRATQAMDSLVTMIGQIDAGGGKGKSLMPPPTRRTTTYTTALR